MPVFSAYFLFAVLTAQPIDEAITSAWQRNEPLPLAHFIDETLTIERAYRIQTRIVRSALRGRPPAGFKAGLTSESAQMRFRATAPVAGVLLDASTDASHDFQLSVLRGLHLETEVALRVGMPIRGQLGSIDELKSHIDGVAAAVELPNLDYQDPGRLTVVDIVATNVGAAAFVLGEFEAPSSRDPNAATAILECNGEAVSSGRGRDALGDQWTAALWLVNSMIEQGWKIEAGQILLTGALGHATPARPGRCIGDFAEWGRIELRILP